ncbi:MAG: putative inorganic carbon transporter subunit DabA, partial [Deltaproteobacteria bacterium]
MSSSQSLTDWIKSLDIFGKPQGRIPFDLDTTLKHLSHLLPNQGPIKDFIHHNPLHGFQNLPFHEGVALASRIFGSKSYLDLAFYESQFSQGKITEDHLDFILNSQNSSKEIRESLKVELLNFKSKNENRSQNVREWGLRSYWNHHYQIDLANTSSPLIYKILSHYLDQGVAFWPFTSRKDSLWLSLKKLQEQNFFPLLPFSKNKLLEILSQNPTQAIETALTHLVGTPELFTRYLVETLLSYPGWSGMVCSLENNPSALRKPTSISLKEFLALALSVEYLIIDQEIPTERVVPNLTDFLTQNSTPIESSVSKLRPIWHEAFEWSFYDQLLRSVYHLPNHKKPPTPKAWAQAIFCIDDRECSLRRYLEMIDPGITTFGTAGFFGVDFWFLAHNELYPLQQSPVTITPKHLIRSRPKNKLEPERKVKDDILETAFGGLVKDLFLVPFLSVSALTQLVKSIFFHKSASAMASSLTQFESQVVLEFTNSDSEAVDQRFKNGFTVEEMTERVARTLRTIGLTKDFADSIYVIAHGA